jgi:GST-like protein
MIDFYTAATPAAFSVAITLEELGLPYELHPINLGVMEHKGPEYLKINPNGRVPALYDRETGVTVWESAAMRLYLAEKTGRLLPKDPVKRWQAVSYMILQVASIGPNQGQANCFIHYFGETLPSVVSRFKHETLRLYGVLEQNLAQQDYLAGEYSIADCGVWPWIRLADYAELSLEPFPSLRAWYERVGARPAVLKGGSTPAAPPMNPEESLRVGRSMVMR